MPHGRISLNDEISEIGFQKVPDLGRDILELKLLYQFNIWIPILFPEVHDLIFNDLDLFLLKKGLHAGGWLKVMLSRKQTIAINHPMRWNIFRAAIHGPAYHAGAHFSAQVIRNRTIARNASFWDEPSHFIHIAEKIGFIWFFGTCHEPNR
jgi:hypothetical protein